MPQDIASDRIAANGFCTRLCAEKDCSLYTLTEYVNIGETPPGLMRAEFLFDARIYSTDEVQLSDALRYSILYVRTGRNISLQYQGTPAERRVWSEVAVEK